MGVRIPPGRLEKARLLRSEGVSVGGIAVRLGVAKSSVSLWVRDVKLTFKQRKDLDAQGRNNGAYLVAAQARREHAAARHRLWEAEARESWPCLSAQPLFMLGVGLYWGEGTKEGVLSLSNADPAVHRVWLVWCRKYMPGVPLRCRLRVHQGVRSQRARRFWEVELGVDVTAVYRFPARRTARKKTSMPFGVVQIAVGRGSVEWLCKMKTWLALLQASVRIG